MLGKLEDRGSGRSSSDRDEPEPLLILSSPGPCAPLLLFTWHPAVEDIQAVSHNNSPREARTDAFLKQDFTKVDLLLKCFKAQFSLQFLFIACAALLCLMKSGKH